MPFPTRTQGVPSGVLNATASVYASSDDFTAAVKTGLKVRLAHLSTAGAPTAADRAELAALRRLYWAEAYAMPEGAQVEVEGRRWNTIRGTFAAVDAFSNADVLRCCDVRPAG